MSIRSHRRVMSPHRPDRRVVNSMTYEPIHASSSISGTRSRPSLIGLAEFYVMKSEGASLGGAWPAGRCGAGVCPCASVCPACACVCWTGGGAWAAPT